MEPGAYVMRFTASGQHWSGDDDHEENPPPPPPATVDIRRAGEQGHLPTISGSTYANLMSEEEHHDAEMTPKAE
jgi:hypothetical protein